MKETGIISNRVKTLLKEKKLTQQQLAEGIGVSLQAVKQMIHASSLTTTTIQKIADFLDVEIWELLVSREEIIGHNSDSRQQIYGSCPYCGQEISISIEKRE